MAKHGIKTKPKHDELSDRIIVDYLSRRARVQAADFPEGDPLRLDFKNEFGITFRQFMAIHIRMAFEQGRWEMGSGPQPPAGEKP